MNKKALYLCAFLAMGLFSFLAAKDVTEVQSIDGSQRNQITPSSGGGTFDTSLSYTLTGPWLFTSNITVRTMMGINTNVVASAWNGDDYVLWARPNPNNSSPTTARIGILGANGSQYTIGDGGTLFASLGYTGGNLRLTADGGGGVSYFINVGGVSGYTQTSTGTTLGNSSSSTLTVNGATASYPNGVNINSGVEYIPSSTSGTSTNANFTALSTYYSQSVLTPGTTVNIDFSGADNQILNNTTNVTLTTSNERRGKTVLLQIWNDANARTLTTPAGWVAGNTAIPTGLTASKLTTLTLVCTGNTAASTVCYTSNQP